VGLFTQLPDADHILSILKDLYHTDQYTSLDGDKTATVQPSFGVKQGCPLSLLLFAIFLSDIDREADRVKGAFTGTCHARLVQCQIYAAF